MTTRGGGGRGESPRRQARPTRSPVGCKPAAAAAAAAEAAVAAARQSRWWRWWRAGVGEGAGGGHAPPAPASCHRRTRPSDAAAGAAAPTPTLTFSPRLEKAPPSPLITVPASRRHAPLGGACPWVSGPRQTGLGGGHQVRHSPSLPLPPATSQTHMRAHARGRVVGVGSSRGSDRCKATPAPAAPRVGKQRWARRARASPPPRTPRPPTSRPLPPLSSLSRPPPVRAARADLSGPRAVE